MNLWVAATREAKIGGSIHKHFIVGAGCVVAYYGLSLDIQFRPILAARKEY